MGSDLATPSKIMNIFSSIQSFYSGTLFNYSDVFTQVWHSVNIRIVYAAHF
jgi:hypothetical protein